MITLKDKVRYLVNILINKASLLSRKEGISILNAKILVLNTVIFRLYEKLEVHPPYSLNIRDDIEVPQKIIEILYKNFDEYIDDLYQEFIPEDYRHKRGQIFTPRPIATFMTKIPLMKLLNRDNKSSIRILDAGVGTGIFASELFDLIKILNVPKIEYYAIDTDKLMLNITHLRLYLKGLLPTHKHKLYLVNDDYLKFNISKDLDVVISNPPYINFRNYDTTVINLLSKKIGIDITRLTNIYALFMLKALNELGKDGLLVFITPSEYLFTRYGVSIREALIKYTIHSIIMFDPRLRVFEKAMVTPVITIVQKTKPTEDHRTFFIVTSSTNLEPIVSTLVDGGIFKNKKSKIYTIKQSSLSAKEKWIHLFYRSHDSSLQIDTEELNALKKISIPLKAVAKIKRGIATGYNDFFLLNKNDVRKWGIESKYLRIAVSKARHCRYYNLTYEDIERLIEAGEKVFLLYITKTNFLSNNVMKYLEFGEKIGVNKRYLTAHRNPWYKIEEREPPPILVTTFSRKNFKFIFNEAKALPIASAFHGIYPKITDERKIKALLAYLNSNVAATILHNYFRIHGLGLKKIEPRDIEDMPVLDLDLLSLRDINRLASLFDKLCETSRRSAEEVSDIKEYIDFIILHGITYRNDHTKKGLFRYMST